MDEDAIYVRKNITYAVAEGWVMKDVPRTGESSALLCVFFCFIVIALLVLIAMISGWFTQ